MNTNIQMTIMAMVIPCSSILAAPAPARTLPKKLKSKTRSMMSRSIGIHMIVACLKFSLKDLKNILMSPSSSFLTIFNVQ